MALVSSIDPSFTLQPPDTSSTAPLAAAEPSATANGSTAADGEIPSSSAAPNEPTAAAAGVKGNDNSNNSSKSSSGGSTSNTSVWIRDIDVPKFTDLEDEQGFRYTVKIKTHTAHNHNLCLEKGVTSEKEAAAALMHNWHLYLNLSPLSLMSTLIHNLAFLASFPNRSSFSRCSPAAAATQVYNVRVTQSDDKVWTIGRRYNEVLAG